jgi:palmitoyltransferase ZDHHC13/17
MEVGVIILVRLVLICKLLTDRPKSNTLILLDLEALPEPTEAECNILSESLCLILLKDPYTIVLTLFTAVQLTWVTMLILVQLLQIARAQTTYENMRGNLNHFFHQKGQETIASAVTAGSTSLEGAQLTPSGMGPDPVAPSSRRSPRPRHDSSLTFWKRLLGLDTFVATARRQVRPEQNPFSRGPVTNCKDFWCDGSPFFGKKQNGRAALGGEVVDYARLYDIPPRSRNPMTREAGGGGAYQNIAVDDMA